MRSRLTEGLLCEKQKMNRNVTLNAVYARLCEENRIRALSCEWKPGEIAAHPSWDSDVAKWMEAACEALKRNEDAELRAKVESIVDTVIANQRGDGYFVSYYLVAEPDKTFTYRPAHELYCAGHWFEAAVSHYEMSGDDRFLKAMTRFADCIYDIFVVRQSAAFLTPYHPEIELALVKLYRCTGEEKYLRLAGYFLDARGRRGNVRDVNEESLLQEEPMPVGVPPQHNQSHMPVREMRQAVGHAVCASYLYSGMTDYVLETGDAGMKEACAALFEDILNRKMYITGGTGSTGYGESFTLEYDLPNDTSYCETCAAIAYFFFAFRMLRLKRESRFADVMERILYNAMLSGVSLSGDAFFYVNPLELNLRKLGRHRNGVQPKGAREILPERAKSFNCFCCPPNVSRFLAAVDQYVYMEEADGIRVNLFAGSVYDDGQRRIEQKTCYPRDGRVEFECRNVGRLYVRIPDWCDRPEFDCGYSTENGYAVIENPGRVRVDFHMRPKFYRARSDVRDNYGRTALMNGPVVYCVEGVDNGDIYSLYVDTRSEAEVAYREDFLMNEITVGGTRRLSGGALYSADETAGEAVRIRYVPYAVFGNRGPSDMMVWVAEG